jgi:HEAT repeat protein
VALGAGLGSERIEDALVRALHAADDELRATVVEVLSGSLSTRLPGQLVAGLSEWSRPGQLAALRLLGRLGRVDTAGAFLDRLRDPDEAIRAEALRALGRILGGEARMSVLVPGLDDRSPVVRRAAVEGLSGAGGVEVADRLEQLLGDPDEDVRLLVIETLGRLGRRSAVPRLVAELGRGDRRLDRSVVVALGAIGGRESAQFLTELLRTAEPGQQTVILEALGQIGDERTVPAVLVCLGDPDWSVRNAAVKALGQLRAPGSLPHLVERLDDSEDVVRKQAITALGDLGDARASEAILAQVHEPSLQLEAFAALERLGVPDLEAFERYFARGSSRLKGLLVDLLGRIRQRSAGSFLTGALRQEFFTVRARAARALGELGDGAAVAALRQAYREDPSEEVRREVSAALKHLDGAR